MEGLTKERTPFFDKKTTGIIKGIALIMMCIHHFFTFPEWWGEGISYPLLEQLAPYFREPLKLCVAIFCFITGYFYFYNKKKTYKYSFKKIGEILLTYWFVFAFFAIVARVFLNYKYSLGDFLKECFALYRPTMMFCWYVAFYILFMLVLPLITKIMSKNIFFDIALSLVILPVFYITALKVIYRFFGENILFETVSYFLTWFGIVLVGYIIAAYGIFEKIEKGFLLLTENKVIYIILGLATAPLMIFLRYVLPNITIHLGGFGDFVIYTDILYAPLFVLAVASVCKNLDIKFLKEILYQIGKYSMLMWFVSCGFFNNCDGIFNKVLYLPKNPVLVAIWGLALCFGVSYLFDFAISGIKKLLSSVFRSKKSE